MVKPPENIFNVIESEFSQGFLLDEGVIHFAESTLGMEKEDLVAAIRSGDPEGTGILDLIIIPGSKTKRIIEKYIPPEGIDEKDAGYLADKAHSLIRDTGIIITGDSTEIRIDLVPGFINGYLNKLMLAREVPCKKVLPVSGVHEMFNLDMLVHMRRYYPGFHNREGFDICGVITALRDCGITAAETINAIDLISGTLKRYPGETDLISMVKAEKSFWLNMRDKKKFVEDAVDKYSMEFVMMQKINPGVFSLQDIEMKIETADLILNLVFRDDHTKT
jgi:hypothetical protein